MGGPNRVADTNYAARAITPSSGASPEKRPAVSKGVAGVKASGDGAVWHAAAASHGQVKNTGKAGAATVPAREFQIDGSHHGSAGPACAHDPKLTLRQMQSCLAEIDREIRDTKAVLAAYDDKEAKAYAEVLRLRAARDAKQHELTIAKADLANAEEIATYAAKLADEASARAEEAAAKARTGVRILGGLKVIGGAIEGTLGCPAFETGVGALACAHGADTAGSGLHDLLTGEPSRTVTHTIIKAAVEPFLDEEYADMAGAFGDSAIGVGTTMKLSIRPGPAPRVPAPRGWGGALIARLPISSGSVARLRGAIVNRMIALGIPRGNALGFWPFPPAGGGTADVGSNIAGVGIRVERQVLGAMENWPEWNAASLSTRVDAVIAHEWTEFNDMAGGMGAEAAHQASVRTAATTALPISQEARELLATMPGKPRPVPLPYSED